MFNVVHVLGFYMRLCGIGSVALGCRSCRSRQGGGGAGVGGKEPPMLREEKVGISHLATDMTLRRLEVGDKVAERAGRIYLSLSAAWLAVEPLKKLKREVSLCSIDTMVQVYDRQLLPMVG